MRPTRHQIFMEQAFVTAKRATCMRLSVGALIVADRRIVATGYNGAPAGLAHCAGNACPGRMRCDMTIHAEENAFNHMPEPTRFYTRLDMYCTDSPCTRCAELIITKGIKRLFFAYPYRDQTPVENLITKGVEVYRMNLSGYVIRYPDMELVEPWS